MHDMRCAHNTNSSQIKNGRGGDRVRAKMLISLRDALSRIMPIAQCAAEYETVAFDEALGRVIAEDVRSPHDVPPFDRAAMDGYAVRGEDTFGASPENPIKLRRASGLVREREYMPVQTGMKMPDGANAVVMLEHAKEHKGVLNVFMPTPPGRNVSLKGEDVKKGEIIIKSGKILNAYDIGLLASICKTEVKVRKMPEVGILATGDEIFDPRERRERSGGERSGGMIPDSNSYVLSALLSSIARPELLGIVSDEIERLKVAVSDALRSCDVLLMTGGSSVGERDLVEDALENMGGNIIFHGVAIRPGEPVGFAVVRDKPVFMLPGYPVAAISAFELIVKPFLMCGVDTCMKIPAIAARNIPSSAGRTDFVRVKLYESDDKIYASPVRLSGSGILSSMTKSDGYILIEDEKEGVEKGEKVIVHLLSYQPRSDPFIQP